MTPSRPDLVFLHPSDEIYGADRMLLEMLNALPPEQDVEVWVPTDLEHPQHPLCELLRDRGRTVRHVNLPIMRRAYLSPTGLPRLLGRMVGLFRALRRARPQTVYCTSSAGFLCAPVARAVRIPRVIGHVQEIWSATDRRVLTVPSRSCHALLAISDPVRSALSPGLAQRTTVIENGTVEPAIRTPLDGRTGPLTFLVASRWNRWKGHRTLLDAWDLAGSPGRLVVLGGPPLSGDRVDVPALVAGLSDPSSVDVIGEVPDIAPYIEAADVMLVPSDQPEPFGLVAIEAFAHGRPVVGSNGGGLADIVTTDHDGWLFTPGDDGALAAVLLHLDRDTVTAAGGNARVSYEQRYTVTRFAARWQTFVSGVTGTAGSSDR